MRKSFLLLFFKKEVLPYPACPIERGTRPPWLAAPAWAEDR
jgi:hypothetical protein